ncbi:MAG TPA: hypothetical protein VK721_15890 [Solirubrobacteraceae bacterium]|jgi:hypothetical protein|nr:hypothetical protein [Solirubrobacteraceae bacterium]
MDSFRVFADVVNARPVINVHSGDVVAGLVGGVVVLAGVVLTEMLVRHRERRRRLEEATWNLQATTHGGLLIGDVEGMSGSELAARYAAFNHQLFRIRTEARWPIKNAKEITAETEEITLRLMVAVGRMGTGAAGPARLGPVLGERLALLVFGSRGGLTQRVIDERMRAEGLPTLTEITADESTNAVPSN